MLSRNNMDLKVFKKKIETNSYFSIEKIEVVEN